MEDPVVGKVEEAAEAVSTEAVEAASAAQEAAENAAQAAGEAVSEAPVEALDEGGETMADYAAELDASFHKVNEGDVLDVTVVSVDDEQAEVDLGSYTGGVIRREDASDDPSYSMKENLQPGQTLKATVISTDDGQGRIVLSLKQAAADHAWDRLRALMSSHENITVKISGVTKGGAIAMVEDIRGFIPASKLSLGYVEEDKLSDWLGRSIEVRVIDVDESKKHLVLSARDILREKEREARSERIAQVQVGTITEGTVETIKPYGAFIRLDGGLSGLLHVSRISHKRVNEPGDVLKEGQKVRVKIVGNKDGKLSLSMKDLEEAPASSSDDAEEKVVIPKAESIGTSMADLIKGLNIQL